MTEPHHVLPMLSPCNALTQLWACADVLSTTIWLVPARKENIAVNVPPYLNAETTVLQDINDTGYFQASTRSTRAYSVFAQPPGLHCCRYFLSVQLCQA